MNFPPYLLRLRIRNRRRRIRLWLPLFLLWPLAVVLALILTPFMLILAIVFLCRGWGRLLLAGPVIFRCLSALSGLEVDVKRDHERIIVSFC